MPGMDIRSWDLGSHTTVLRYSLRWYLGKKDGNVKKVVSYSKALCDISDTNYQATFTY